jgi:copper chaperone CopZ
MKVLQMLTAAVLLVGMAGAKETTTQIKVSGMTCGACAVSVRAALIRTKGVKSADVSAEKGTATVVYDDSQVNRQRLVEAINKTGFKVEAGKEK